MPTAMTVTNRFFGSIGGEITVVIPSETVLNLRRQTPNYLIQDMCMVLGVRHDNHLSVHVSVFQCEDKSENPQKGSSSFCHLEILS